MDGMLGGKRALCVPGQLRARADRAVVPQVGFGSGFKCNSAVWKAVRNIHDTEHSEWAHMEGSNLERCWKYVQVRNRATCQLHLNCICAPDRGYAYYLQPGNQGQQVLFQPEVSSEAVPMSFW